VHSEQYGIFIGDASHVKSRRLTLGVRRGGQRERSGRWQPSPARHCSA
jgi:hypothetical protein